MNTSIFEAATRSIAHGVKWDFFCECGDDACDERIALTQDEYEQLRDSGRPIVARGHQVDKKLRARALREDARALRAQAQLQARRAQKTRDESCPRP